MPPYAASLPPPPARWVRRADAGEQGAAEDDAALWDVGSPHGVREAAEALARHCRDTALDVYAAFLAFITQLVTAETFAVAAVAVGAVFAFTRGFQTGGHDHSHRINANLNWAVFSSAVVFPLCALLRELAPDGL